VPENATTGGRPTNRPPNRAADLAGRAAARQLQRHRRRQTHYRRVTGRPSIRAQKSERKRDVYVNECVGASRRTLEQARRSRPQRHVEAQVPGELVRLDCFYVGKLKGVGKVWQITACDAASSYATARVFVQTQPTAETAARFLRHDLVPLYREAGWPIQRVLTDRGSEFAGTFAKTCQELGIRHTQTQPRHAWTNGFVERLQGTILHEHWRVEFRRRYFTQLPQLQRSLESFLRIPARTACSRAFGPASNGARSRGTRSRRWRRRSRLRGWLVQQPLEG
jgi:hypothetical protein